MPKDVRAEIARIGIEKYPAMKFSNVRWDFDREVWIGQTSQKVFSRDWIADHSVGDIEKTSRERLQDGEFRIYFNDTVDVDRIAEMAGRYDWKISLKDLR